MMMKQTVLLLSDSSPGEKQIGGIYLESLLYGTNTIVLSTGVQADSNIACNHVSEETKTLNVKSWGIPSALNFSRITNIIYKALCRNIEMHKPSIVGFILQNPAIVYAARKFLFTHSSIPKFGIIWDPPKYVIKNYTHNPTIKYRYYASFLKVLNNMNAAIFASKQMMDIFSKCELIDNVYYTSHGYPYRDVEKSVYNEDYISIGFCGSMYTPDNWNILLQSIEILRHEGIPIRISIAGSSMNINTAVGINDIKYYGYRTKLEMDDIFRTVDMMYLPYSFSQRFRNAAMMSFPNKMGYYVSIQKPVFFHGPKYSSVIYQYDSGYLGPTCTSNSVDAISKCIRDYYTKRFEKYEYFTRNVSIVFREKMNEHKFQSTYRNLLSELTNGNSNRFTHFC